jgi:IS1 family transposase/transposase-like protein
VDLKRRFTVTCHNCRIDCSKAGRRRDGLQRYRCGQCGKTYSDHKEFNNVCGHKQAVPDEKALLALQLLVEGNSIRSAERITGLHRDTIMKLVVAAGERCERLLATKIRNVQVEDVQCDEIWSFCYKKESRRVFGDKNFHYIGDAWTFIAIERGSKLVLAFELGKRNTRAACRFTQKIAAATAEKRFQLTTDGFPPYNYAVGTHLGDRCDYAQLVKIYAAPTPEEQRRYSPAHVVEAIPTEVYGDPDRERICTSHIERLNGSLRQWCKRLTRLTYAFSKKWENLRAALALHFAFYNFCRIHGTLRATPAMKAGIAGRVWTLQELVAA